MHRQGVAVSRTRPARRGRHGERKCGEGKDENENLIKNDGKGEETEMGLDWVSECTDVALNTPSTSSGGGCQSKSASGSASASTAASCAYVSARKRGRGRKSGREWE
eukprot:33980-Pleurochrysis_carterae.AAC.1